MYSSRWWDRTLRAPAKRSSRWSSHRRAAADSSSSLSWLASLGWSRKSLINCGRFYLKVSEISFGHRPDVFLRLYILAGRNLAQALLTKALGLLFIVSSSRFRPADAGCVIVSNVPGIADLGETTCAVDALFALHVYFPALFFRQRAFCVAEIFLLAAALIFLLALTRLPPNAAIAATTPSSFFASRACSFLSACRMFMEVSARILP